MTELRLAGVTTIDEANAVLHRFLPRFNEKFGVPAEHSSVAYRPMEPSVSLVNDVNHSCRLRDNHFCRSDALSV